VLEYWIDDEDRAHGYAHHVLEVWSFTRTEPKLRFAHEIATAGCCGSEANAPPNVTDSVAIEPGRITIEARTAWRARADTWAPHALVGIPPTIAPWDRVKIRVFRWNGNEFSE
jgi:hypothetical protein